MSNAFKQITAGSKPLSTDVDQFRLALTGAADVGALSLFQPIANPAPPTLALVATGGVLNGAYKYVQVNVTGWVGSDGTFYVAGFAPSAASASISPASQQVTVTLTTGPTGTIARAIYRTVAGGSTYSFCTWVPDNTTTSYQDNVADGSLGTGMPSVGGNAIPSAVPAANTTGTTLTGAGGQSGDATEVLLTSTSATNVLSYTPPKSGNYVIYCYVRVVTAATNLTINFTYNDAGGAQTYAAQPSASVAVGSHSLFPFYVNATTGAPIIVQVTAGTANQAYVSASVLGV